MLWEVCGHSCQNGEEVGLACADGAFGGVTAMDVCWDQLVLHTVLECDDSLAFCAGLVVHDLQVDVHAMCLETLHDVMISEHAVLVAA